MNCQKKFKIDLSFKAYKLKCNSGRHIQRTEEEPWETFVVRKEKLDEICRRREQWLEDEIDDDEGLSLIGRKLFWNAEGLEDSIVDLDMTSLNYQIGSQVFLLSFDIVERLESIDTNDTYLDIACQFGSIMYIKNDLISV